MNKKTDVKQAIEEVKAEQALETLEQVYAGEDPEASNREAEEAAAIVEAQMNEPAAPTSCFVVARHDPDGVFAVLGAYATMDSAIDYANDADKPKDGNIFVMAASYFR